MGLASRESAASSRLLSAHKSMVNPQSPEMEVKAKLFDEIFDKTDEA